MHAPPPIIAEFSLKALLILVLDLPQVTFDYFAFIYMDL
jgi:hypothetical protein